MRYGDRGPEVMDVQRALIQRGYALPKYGIDGDLGNETWHALQLFASGRGLPWTQTQEVPGPVLAALEPAPVVTDFHDLSLVKDLTSLQPNPPPVGPDGKCKHKIVSGKVFRRDPKSIQGIVIHQTATPFSVSASQIQSASGNREEALHRRGLNVGCHVIAFDGAKAGVTCGHVCYVNPLDWYVYHGNQGNSASLGLEIEGAFYGCIQNGQLQAPPHLIAAAKQALAFMVTKGRAMGMDNLRYIWAHRQMSSEKRGDPGEELWKRVVLDYAVPVLGLQTQPTRVWPDTSGPLGGRPIPLAWDPAGQGSY
jgi:hypothetical protein